MRYQNNASWLLRAAPFKGLNISAAYLTPFFFHTGLNLSQIFLLQSIFSAAFLLWEIPSGYIATGHGYWICELSCPSKRRPLHKALYLATLAVPFQT